MSRARLADIAVKAGVSEATVSRVLNGRPGVAEDTRQAVLTALDVLGFERPTRLRRRSAGLVGLVMPELINPIFPAFAQVIESTLSQRGYTPVLCTQSPSGATEDEYVEMLLERGVSGIIFVSGLHADSGADHARYQALVERRLPVVFVNGWLPDVDAPFISSDEYAAMELAVAHLVALGHRRIGFASGPERFLVVQRKLAGYRTAMKAQLGLTDDRRRRVGRAEHVRRRGRRGGGPAAARPRRQCGRLWLGHDGARRDPRRPPARSLGAGRVCRWWATTTPR